MSDLDSIESSGNQWLEPLAPSQITGVCPDRESAGLVRDCDSILDRKLLLGHEGAAVAAKVCHERIAEIVNNAAGNEGASDVRTANGPSLRLKENLIEGDRNSERVELLDDFFGAREALSAQFQQAHLESLEMSEVQSQHVNLVIVLEGAELRTRDHPDAESLTCRAGCRNSADRVVVGERNGLEAATRRSLDYLLWWKNAVRGGRMGMQVDERRPARLGAHFA